MQNVSIGQLDTYSYIYRYSVEHGKFVVSQRLRSHAAVDLKYFELAESGKTERFLVLANSYMQQNDVDNGTTQSSDSETHSIIYKYANDFFMPFQSILLYEVEQFLPVLVGFELRYFVGEQMNRNVSIERVNVANFY